jgi:hypothetical protein
VASLDLAVDRVEAQVGLAAHEPLGVGAVPLEDLAPGLEPVQLLGHLAPEALRVVDGPLVLGLVILHRGDVGAAHAVAEAGGGGEDPVFLEDGVDAGLVAHGAPPEGPHDTGRRGRLPGGKIPA